MSVTLECNVCRSLDGDFIKKGVYGNPNQDIYKCRGCEHVYIAPFLDDSEEAKFYLEQYSAFLHARGDAKSATRQEHFDGNKKEGDRRYEYSKDFLDKNMSVLEIGSASAFFLARIKPFVKDVTGIEQNVVHKEFANALDIPTFNGFENIEDKKFDIIFLYYLLEHIKYPVDFVNSITKRLKGDSSKIILEVPNVNEALVSLYKSSAYNEFVWQRAHCSYFSVKVLENMFSTQGFKTTFVPVQRYDLSNHIYWLGQGKGGGMGKYSHVFSDELNAQYRKDLNNHWLSDSILLIAELGKDNKW